MSPAGYHQPAQIDQKPELVRPSSCLTPPSFKDEVGFTGWRSACDLATKLAEAGACPGQRTRITREQPWMNCVYKSMSSFVEIQVNLLQTSIQYAVLAPRCAPTASRRCRACGAITAAAASVRHDAASSLRSSATRMWVKQGAHRRHGTHVATYHCNLCHTGSSMLFTHTWSNKDSVSTALLVLLLACRFLSM